MSQVTKQNFVVRYSIKLANISGKAHTTVTEAASCASLEYLCTKEEETISSDKRIAAYKAQRLAQYKAFRRANR